MPTSITGEQFIRTFRHYLEINKNRLLPVSQTVASKGTALREESPKVNNGGGGNGGGGFIKAIRSLWTNTSPSPPCSTNEPKPNSALGISPMRFLPSSGALPVRSTLTLDIRHLYFLLVQFEYLGLEGTHLPIPEKYGLVETETVQPDGNGKPVSISSVGSRMSTLSLSTGWQVWSNQANQNSRPLHEDIVYIHRYFEQINSIKLNMPQKTRFIKGYENPLPQGLSLPLSCFKHLESLELDDLSYHCIEAWSFLQEKLTHLIIQSGHLDKSSDIIQTPWSQLKVLSLTKNNLTTIDPETAQSAQSITHLNLSGNLLADVPAPLASLYNLSSLNLSNNMITMTTGINTVLGNIQYLNLSGNRLSVLVGLDRLWALEQLDVQNNQIEDIAEIGRLTSLPNIEHIHIEGNPFIQLQPDYRVEIFTIFQKNSLDIKLDGTTASFTERLRIQVPQNNHEPTVSAKLSNNLAQRQASMHWPPPPPNSDSTAEPVGELVSPKVKAVNRTKSKGCKRHVRLGQPKQSGIPIPSAIDDEENKKHVHRLSELEEAVQHEAIQGRKTSSLKSRRSSQSSKKTLLAEEKAAALAGNSENKRRASEVFRKKIEAIRREAGTEWLRVLQEMDIVKKDNSANQD